MKVRQLQMIRTVYFPWLTDDQQKCGSYDVDEADEVDVTSDAAVIVKRDGVSVGILRENIIAVVYEGG